MKFSEYLYNKLQPLWRQNHEHPFVKEMGSGTLELAKFRFYMIQDYVYLIDYAKLFALGALKADDLHTMGKFAALLNATLNDEMSLHRAYAARFGISEEELERAEPSPITLAYTHYMLHAAQNGSLADLVAVLLPCMWSYWEIGLELSRIPGASSHEYYGEWIRMYSSDEFRELAQWCIDLFDQLTEGKPERELAKLEEIFLNTTRFETMFWDMVYHQEMWPK
jgi:thiaminase/transcriptional activator TenA